MTALLQGILFERLREAVRFVVSGGFRIARIYQRYRRRPLAEKTVLFEAYMGARVSCNPYAIFVTMIEDPEFADFTFVWTLDFLDPSNRIYAKYRADRRVKFYRRNSLSYLKCLATAKYLVTNKTWHHYFIKRPEQVHISTWHGTTLKTLGKHQYGSMGQYHNVTRNYLQVDYLVMPNKHTADVMLDSCDVRTLFRGVVVDAGQPRSDFTVNSDPAVVKAELAELCGIDPTKRVVLYAPTWRGEVTTSIDITDVILANITELAAGLPEGFELLLKVHDKTYEYAKSNPALSRVANVPDWYETNQLLAGVDVLITDYSSIFFDFLPLQRPIIHYVFDREEYERTRGLYFDMETEMAGPLCLTGREVTDVLARIDEVAEEYRDRHQRLLERMAYHEDGHASERVVDIVFRGKQLEYTFRTEDTSKTRALVYLGALDPANERLQRAISALDFDRIDLTLLFDEYPKSRDEYYLTKLHPAIKVFYRVMAADRSLATRAISQLRSDSVDSLYLRPEVAALWRAEIFGEVDFDVVVDFTGRRSVWRQIFALTPFAKKVAYLPAPFDSDLRASSVEFLADYFDELACATAETYDVYLKRLRDTPAAGKLRLCEVPADMEPFFSSLRDDVAHVVAGIDHCADCLERHVDPYCETNDLLFEFRIGGLDAVELGDYPEISAAVDEFAAEVGAALQELPVFSARRRQRSGHGFGELFLVGEGR